MILSETALRLTVYVSENDQFRHRPLYTEIVHRAHAAGLAGACVIRFFLFFWASSVIYTSRLLSLSEDLPALVIVIDEPERIRGFLPQVQEMVTKGLITLEEVQVVR